jgi:lysophospholipase L1-like esterase
MPVIVVFGDSNTWGSDPATGGRFPRPQRWPSVLQRELGPDFEVIAEGLRGRTTVHDDPIEPYRCGADALPPCLMSHAPADLVILALGCNDLKKRFSLSPFDIAEGAARLIFLARAYGEGPDARPPKILLVAPPPIAKLSAYAEMFEGGAETSRLLGERFRAVAEREGVAFLDAGQVIRCSDRDGIHYEADQHELLGRSAAKAVRSALAAPPV